MAMALSLENYIDSLDPTTLPRVLQILCGIYSEGSVYEIQGQVCCLSTGEIIKIVGFKVVKVKVKSCEFIEGNISPFAVELPLDYPGFFKLHVDPCPYTSLKDIVRSVKIGDNRLGHPHFWSTVDIQLNDILIKKGEHIVLNSLAEVDGEECVNCTVIKGAKAKTLRIPLSFEGTFHECEDDQFYTLKEIVEWKISKHRRRVVKLMKTTATWEESPYNEYLHGDVYLLPVYEVQAMARFGMDILRIPSNLDVEVKDITESYDLNSFVQPMSLTDVYKRPNEDFPLLAVIVDEQCTYKSLMTGKQIIIHSKHLFNTIIASENRSDLNKKHFLIPKSYKGRFKRRPREFPTVYDLVLAIKNNESLHVIATKEFVPEYAEFASVVVGDQFLVHRCQSVEVNHEGEKCLIEAVACERILEKDCEQVLLPTYMGGGFVEVVHDKKQYDILEICKQFSLPFNVKVSIRDLSINDNLAALASLRIEEEIADPCLLISLSDSPSECFRVPVQRVSMTVQVMRGLDADIPFLTPTFAVEEISEEMYYMLRRYENSTLLPPPRPPRKPQSPLTSTKTMRLLPPESKKPDPPKSPKCSTTGKPRNKAKSQRFVPDVTAKSENIAPTLITEPGAPATDTMLLNDLENLDLSDKHDYEYINENEIEDIRKQLNENEHLSKKNCKSEKENQ
ncbi:protein THEMIS isoform X1 [Hypanus sabinus]|uniref:protein THEMIS isoform X1 n=1 Tax=Hypanus sabinus TaxID=79690 RepID=UPI0028C4F275|nr:protein THEMIS isoform X1 [Hypanus sabinus]